MTDMENKEKILAPLGGMNRVRIRAAILEHNRLLATVSLLQLPRRRVRAVSPLRRFAKWLRRIALEYGGLNG